ncbi:MAG: redoxin domain-containing protein [Bacteroidetes bacterium]|nr:redoxin domain-containing protein [Bacteroidota bacterium]
MTPNIYEYSAHDLAGRSVSLAHYKGKVILIVNTASACGYTPQLGLLEELHQMYQDRGLVVIGFPSASFAQEPLEGEELSEFCERNYGVTFPVMSKVDVTGTGAHPVFHFLSDGNEEALPKWNFFKYLVDRSGKVANIYPSNIEPGDEALIAQIEKLLG